MSEMGEMSATYYCPEEHGELSEWWEVQSSYHSTWWNIHMVQESTWWEMAGEQYEEGTWIEGKSGTLPIEWYHILDWIEVADDREIVSVRIEPKTKAHQGGGHYDAFSVKYNMEFLKLFGAERIDICLEETNNNLEIPMFGAVEHSVIKAVYLNPEANATGHDTDYMVLKLVNKLTGGIICTKTYIEGNDITAWKLDQFGPANKTHGLILQGETASLVVEKHGSGFTIPRSVVIVLWDYATDRDFEDAGVDPESVL